MVFEQVVSLGAWCQTAHQITRRFGRAQGTFFDNIGTPARGLLTLLEGKGAALGESFVPILGGTDLRCVATSVIPHHEFMRDGQGRVLLDEGVMDRCRSRLRARWDRFVTACESGRPTLFVRHGGFEQEMGPIGPLDRKPDPEGYAGIDLHWICEALRWRFPDTPFHLAFAYHPEMLNFDPSQTPPEATVHAFPSITTHDWRGDDSQWDALFDRFSYAEQRPGLRVVA